MEICMQQHIQDWHQLLRFDWNQPTAECVQLQTTYGFFNHKLVHIHGKANNNNTESKHDFTSSRSRCSLLVARQHFANMIASFGASKPIFKAFSYTMCCISRISKQFFNVQCTYNFRIREMLAFQLKINIQKNKASIWNQCLFVICHGFSIFHLSAVLCSKPHLATTRKVNKKLVLFFSLN